MFLRHLLILFGFLCLFARPAAAADPEPLRDLPRDYRIAPGDVLEISVWREEGLANKVLVRPDGGITFALVGNIQAGGLTLEQLRAELKARLSEFLTAPEVTVAVLNSNQKVYVVGKVNKPGEFPVFSHISVMQALAMAGGLNPYADRDDIVILRRTEKGEIKLPFDYDAVESGEGLEQNILLQNGDVVVVP